jgi:hypothetical protein
VRYRTDRPASTHRLAEISPVLRSKFRQHLLTNGLPVGGVFVTARLIVALAGYGDFARVLVPNIQQR